MKTKLLFLITVSILVLFSCEPNEPDSVYINTAPVVPAQTFTIPEDFPDGELIGSVQATDKDEDTLEFALLLEASGLFELSKNGNLFLAAGKMLSYANQKEHTLEIYVHDGIVGRKGIITINVNPPENLAPIVENQSFAVSESITGGTIIDQIEAEDPENGPLTYSIVEDEDDLFEINDTGALILAVGKMLDFETATEHNIMVSVSDGTFTEEAEVTITVLDAAEAHPDDKAAFVTTWQTDADGETIYIGLNDDYNYDFTINWGDGTVEELNLDNPDYIEHIYESADQYKVSIVGAFPAIKMVNLSLLVDNKPGFGLIGLEQWGTIKWQTMFGAFYEASSLEFYNATDAPDLSQVTTLRLMFGYASMFNGDLSSWDTGNVIDMSRMFSYAYAFNGDVSQWNTSQVTDMSGMFTAAVAFNGDLHQWETGAVTDMSSMFNGAAAFNGDIKGWDTGAVTDMHNMFLVATSFNQNLGGWDISSIDPDDPFGQMKNMLDNSGLSSANYSATLIGWASKGAPNIPDTITLGANGLYYCAESEAARNSTLMIDNEWEISDEGLTDQCGL